MIEEVASQVIKLAGQTLGLPALLLVIVGIAVLLVVLKKAGDMKLPPSSPLDPDPEELVKSPPITVRPDGSIPVSNEQGSPDPEKG